MKSKVKINELAPKLRFPEFMDVWEEKKLSDVAQLIDERAGDKKFTLLSVTSGVGLVSQIEKFGREIAGNQYKNYYVIRKWDFAYNKSATKLYPEGFISMLTEQDAGAVPNSIFTCFRIIDKNIWPHFLNYLFHDNFHGKWLRKFIEVGARAHGSLSIDDNVLLAMPIAFPPSKSEQQKIANCLTFLDDLIAAETQKLDKLKEHKKGLMQNLFPAEGETVPKVRFKEFQGAGEWNEKMLENVADIVTGSTPSTAKSKYYGGKRIFVSPADISELRYVSATKTTLTDAGFEETRPIKANSILFVCIGSTIGKIAQNEALCATNQQINSVIPFAGYDNNFIYSALEFNSDKIASIAGKHAVPIINKTDFSNTKLFIPTFEEQLIIASCFSSLDNLITTQTKKIELLKLHKKGLMQQLFPKVEEVAG